MPKIFDLSSSRTNRGNSSRFNSVNCCNCSNPIYFSFFLLKEPILQISYIQCNITIEVKDASNNSANISTFPFIFTIDVDPWIRECALIILDAWVCACEYEKDVYVIYWIYWIYCNLSKYTRKRERKRMRPSPVSRVFVSVRLLKNVNVHLITYSNTFQVTVSINVIW